jgi:hypothetical protein
MEETLHAINEIEDTGYAPHSPNRAFGGPCSSNQHRVLVVCEETVHMLPFLPEHQEYGGLLC